MHKLFSGLLILCISGCASFAWKMPNNLQRSEVTAESSIVILSTWAQDKGVSASEVAIKRKADGKIVAGAPIDNYALKSHFADGWGFMNAFHLPPGEYLIELYAVNPYYKYETKQPIQFSVTGNQVIYLGEAYFYASDGYGHIRMRDKSIRDIPLFISNNPAFVATDIVKSIPGTSIEP